MSFDKTIEELKFCLDTNAPMAVRVVTEDPDFFSYYVFPLSILEAGAKALIIDDQIVAHSMEKGSTALLNLLDPALIDPKNGKNLQRNFLAAFEWAVKKEYTYFVLKTPVNVADADKNPVGQKAINSICLQAMNDYLIGKQRSTTSTVTYPKIIIIDKGQVISSIETKVRKFILPDMDNKDKSFFIDKDKKSLILKAEFKDTPDFKGVTAEGVLLNYRKARCGLKALTDQNMKSEFFTLLEDIPCMEDVAGLIGVKQFISDHKLLFQNLDKIHEHGIEAPRGILLTGIQGCGKSWVSKAIGCELGLPLFEFNLSRVLQGLVGSSEANMQAALKKLETISPCIIFMDEIDKQVGGVASSNKSDGGTLLRVVGMFLTFLQESTSSVFLVGTSNNFDALPPELVSRLDEVFFVDLPMREEREDLLRLKINDDRFDINFSSLSNIEGLTGREIHKAVNYAKTLAFKRSIESGKDYFLTTEDVQGSLQSMTKLSETMEDEVTRLKERLFGVAKNANQPYRNFDSDSQTVPTNVVEFGKKK